jgi:hypothetical protein
MRIINFSVILILNGDQKEENQISKKNIFLIHTQKKKIIFLIFENLRI